MVKGMLTWILLRISLIYLAPLIYHLIQLPSLKLEASRKFLITRKVSDVRRRGATTEAYGDIRRRKERSKATPQTMP